jgi:hypothetical protein
VPPRILLIAPVSRTVSVMLGTNLLVWNVRGVNSRARRDVVREFMSQEHASIACLVETKVDVMPPAMATDLMGTSFDYACVPADGLSGGIMVAWCRDVWTGLCPGMLPAASRL